MTGQPDRGLDDGLIGRGDAAVSRNCEAHVSARQMRFRRVAGAVFLILFAPACTQWKPASLEPTAIYGKRVRATLESGQQLVIASAYVQHDSLLSVTTGQGVPVKAIRQIDVRAVDGATTTAVVLGGVAAVLVGVLIWAQCCFELNLNWN